MSDQTVAQAVRDIVLGLSPAIIPKTTQNGANLVGDQQITLTSASGFAEGGLLQWDDALGEAYLPVSSLTGNVTALDFNGQSYTGLQQAHTNGTTVYTNLFTDVPIQFGPMLVGGKPVINISVTNEVDNLRIIRVNYAQYKIRVEYRRLLMRPGDPSLARMNVNAWALQQQQSARADLERIAFALRTNIKLTTTQSGPHTVDLGSPGQRGAPRITRNWTRLTADADLQVFYGSLDCDAWAPLESF